jgi:hypothetical protein
LAGVVLAATPTHTNGEAPSDIAFANHEIVFWLLVRRLPSLDNLNLIVQFPKLSCHASSHRWRYL